MSFPFYPMTEPMGMGSPMGAFPMGMSPSMFGSVPGAFPPPVPLAMGVPSIYPPTSSFGVDPFAMPPMFDPLSGIPMGGGYNMSPIGMPPVIDPMTSMPLGAGYGGVPVGMPPMIDPMTGFPIDPMSGLPMDPMTGLPINIMPPHMSGPIPLGMDPMAGLPMMPSPIPQPEPENPLKKMLKTMLTMQIFQQLFKSKQTQGLGLGNDGLGNLDEDSVDEEVVVADNATALDIIGDVNNFAKISGGDGSVSFLDLSRAARTSKSAEVKAAASYILNTNPQLFDKLEAIRSKGDGVFTEDDISKAMQVKEIVQGKPGQGTGTGTGTDGEEAVEEISDPISALDALTEHFDELEEAGGGTEDGTLNFVELSRAATKSEDPQIKALAKYLRSSGLFTRIDDVNANTDGVSLSDINEAYRDTDLVQGRESKPTAIDTSGMTEKQALVIVNNNVGKFDTAVDPKNKARTGKSDSKISVEDLDAIINSKEPTITVDMKKAAQVLKDNGTIGKMDVAELDNTQTADIVESSDGSVAFDTIRTWATSYDTAANRANAPKDLQTAMGVINANISVFERSGKVAYGDIISAITSNDAKYTPEIKAAAQYIKDNKDQFDIIDIFDDGYAGGSVPVDLISQTAANGTSFTVATTELNATILKWMQVNFVKIEDNVGQDGDDHIHSDDIMNALSDTSGKWSADDKMKLRYLYYVKQNGGKTLYECAGGRDMVIGTSDLKDVLGKDHSPANVGANYLAHTG